MSFFTRRRPPVDDRSKAMPAPVMGGARLYQDHIPSFMSVYNVEDSSNNRGPGAPSITQSQAPAGQGVMEQAKQRDEISNQSQVQHKHCDSTSTQTSESTDSSPTTTISTVDSASLTDPSPSSSPESPISLIPLSSFGATHLGIQSLQDLKMNEVAVETNRNLSCERPMTSPSPRRPRNAKGLALKLPSGDTPQQLSEPCSPSIASPSFIKPAVMKPRKKPSILSLQTSATAFKPNSNIEPPTPGFKPEAQGNAIRQTVLRHHHSSPHIMFSPDVRLGGPAGGMQLPDFQRSKVTGLSTVFRKPTSKQGSGSGEPNSTIYEEESSPIKTQMATRSMSNIRGDEFDIPHSQEDSKSPGYPNGPVAIYEPNVYLYLEPTADEAREFDVVINVADDVKNPFEVEREKLRVKAKEEAEAAQSAEPMDIDRSDIPEPSTAISTMTFKTAFEFQPDSQSTPTETSPTTPKPVSGKAEPEYIHVPWQHGTDISRELLELCEVIDKRVKEGKKVLVHCLQGQSRSASLIIAYGIYMNPDLTVNESYYAAQGRSKWISPNMKLMYALNDFRKLLHQKLQASGGFKGRTGRSPTKHRATLSADAIDYTVEQPHTAPLPSERESSPRGVSPPRTPSRPRGNSTPTYGDITPGPSSAPSSFSWGEKKTLSPENNFGLWSKDNGFFSKSQPSSSVTNKMPSLAKEPQLSPPRGFGSHRRLHQLPDRTLPSLQPSSIDVQMTGSPEQPSRVPPPPPERILGTPDHSYASSPALSLGNEAPLKQQFVSLRSQPLGPPSPSLWSPRIQEMNGSHFGFPQIVVPEEVPPTPSIMSPRATNFSLDPINRPTFSISQDAASSLGFGFMSTGPATTVRSEQDPRSPPTKGEAPILRSIDDMV